MGRHWNTFHSIFPPYQGPPPNRPLLPIPVKKTHGRWDFVEVVMINGLVYYALIDPSIPVRLAHPCRRCRTRDPASYMGTAGGSRSSWTEQSTGSGYGGLQGAEVYSVAFLYTQCREIEDLAPEAHNWAPTSAPTVFQARKV